MKKSVLIAVGVLRRPDGAVLIAQRPDGKEMAGAWEFPGGKVEAGESVETALRRELREELGIEVRSARRLIRLRHDYPHKRVELDTWLIDAWDGSPQALERQALAWSGLPDLAAYELLPADGPIVTALGLPSCYVFTPPDAAPARLRRGLHALPAGELLRLRLPRLDEESYAAAARALAPDCTRRGLRLVLDRAPALSRELAAGWHASEAVLRSVGARPQGLPLAIASCHGDASLAMAAAKGFDAAVLGPVAPTRSHPGKPGLGWSAFGRAVSASGLPVYGIGGLGPRDLEQAWAAGGQGIAGISAWWPPDA